MRAFNYLFGGFVFALIAGVICLALALQAQSIRIENLERFATDYQFDAGLLRTRMQDAKISLAAIEQATLQRNVDQLESYIELLRPSLPPMSVPEVAPAPSTVPDLGRLSNPVYRTPKLPEASK
jgi:hypothetical protein